VRKALVLTGVAGLLMLAACGKEEAGSASPAAGSSASTAAKADPAKLGPVGYGGIKLGDSAAAVKAAGVKVDDDDSPCLVSADLKGPSGFATVLISAKYGVYLISANDAIPTPEGIKIGSTLAEVKQAYPQATNVVGDPVTDEERTRMVVVPGNPKAHYYIGVKDGKVDGVDLRLLDCTS
jgi:hypothetical protein